MHLHRFKWRERAHKTVQLRPGPWPRKEARKEVSNPSWFKQQLQGTSSREYSRALSEDNYISKGLRGSGLCADGQWYSTDAFGG